MKLPYIIAILILCSVTGCGFKAKAWLENGIWHYESNRPSSFEVDKDKFKGDGKGEPLFKLDAPDVVGGKIGG